MSVMRELTIAVLMRFAITPKDPTTALVSLAIREMEGPVQVNNGSGEWRKVSWQSYVAMAGVTLEVRQLL